MKNFSTIFLLSLIAVVGVFTLDVYLPGMPAMASQFSVSITEICYTFTGFSIVFAISQLFHGALSDRFGRKPILITGLIIAAIATLFCITAKTYAFLLSARLVQATGISAFVVVNAIIRDLFTGVKAIQVRTLITTISGVSISVAPSVGGLLESRFNWQGGFIASLLLIIIALISTIMFFTESNANQNKISLKFNSLAKSYYQLFLNGRYLISILSATLAYTVHFSFIILSANIFINLLGFSPLVFGLLMFVYGGVYFLCGLGNAYLAMKYSISSLIKVGGICLGVGGILLLTLSYLISFRAWPILLPMAVITFGVTTVRAAAATNALSLIPKQAGQGAAGLNLVQFMVSALIASAISGLSNEPQLSIALLAIISSVSINYLVKGI